MASPLRWFRKHSFFFIVVFGVFLMAIFGLGSVISGLNPSSMGRRAQVENSTFASWAGGQLNQMDVATLRTRHFASLRFLRNVYKYAVEQNDGNSFPVNVEQILPIANGNENPSVKELDDRILNRYLFAKRAEQEGFVVDEKMVYEYIAQYGGDTILTKEILKQLNRQVNQQLPLTAIVRHLQTELLWQQMESMTDGGLAFDPGVSPQSPRRLASLTAIAPTEAMQLYQKSSKKIECVVLPFSIEEYVSKISDEPSSSELKALYEEGKYDYPVYSLDSPGFKQLNKAKVQYFKAEMQTFLDNEIAKLTDEEIQAEYDRLVEAEDKSVMQVVPLEEEKMEENSTSEEQQPDPSSDDPAPSPADGGESESTENGDDSSSEPVESPTETPVVDEPALEESTEENEGGYTSIRFQEEENEVPNENEQGTKTETDDVDAATDPAGADAATPQEDAPADEPATDAEASDDTDDEAQQDPVIEDEPKTKLIAKPLTEVVDQIKRQMKLQDANKARDAALAAAEKAVTFFQRDLSTYEMNVAAGKSEIEKPEVPNFKALADELGIQFFETELIDQTQIGDEDIGKVVDISIGPGGRAMQVNVGQQIFQEFDNLPAYQVLTANDFINSEKYMYWLAEKIDQRVPTLEEAKESIVQYWKHNKAVDMATEDANKIKEQINGSEGTLLNAMKPENAKLTGQFSWFSSFGRFDYGAPEGVKNPSENFMNVAFGLDKQKAGVAINETRDEVYVVQNITPDAAGDEDIASEYLEKKFFLTKQVPREVISAKARYRQLMIEDWIKDFRETMDIKVMGQ